VWDVDRGTRVARSPAGGGDGSDIEFSPTAPTIASAQTGTIRFWDIDGDRVTGGKRLVSHQGEVNSVGFSRDGAMVVSGGDDGNVRLWDVARRAPLGDPLYAGGTVSDAVVSSRGTIASAGRGVEVWDDLLLSRDYDAWRARFCRIVRSACA
jgi:WD40 repeat protein